MTLEQILNSDGIVIRKVPEYTEIVQRILPDNEEKHLSMKHFIGEGAKREELVYEYHRNEQGVLIATSKRKNIYAGYLITFQFNQNAHVHFYKKTMGHGKTIVEAYNNYIKKS